MAGLWDGPIRAPPSQDPPPPVHDIAPVDEIWARRVQEFLGVDGQGPRRYHRLLNVGRKQAGDPSPAIPKERERNMFIVALVIVVMAVVVWGGP
jgi:hypothetical protein